jgi:hypothetical protein
LNIEGWLLNDDDSTDSRARALYEACPTPKPSWAQLGETTRSVWKERAAGEEKPREKATEQLGLF